MIVFGLSDVYDITNPYFLRAKIHFSLFLGFSVFFLACSNNSRPVEKQESKKKEESFSKTPSLKITSFHKGKALVYRAVYEGPEFVFRKGLGWRDSAHLTSKYLTDRLSRFLKSNYGKGHYYRVDLKNIRVTIAGNVRHVWPSQNLCRYTLEIPLSATNRGKAITSIAHLGTWVRDYHRVNKREAFLKKARIEKKYGGKVSMTLVETPEGFKEYWFQFKSRKF
jgi:hypothetical protein